MAVNYVKTYSDLSQEAQRQQRLAEMLQQQAQEPIPQYSYQGIQAMPSYTAGLAKILSAYGAERARRKAEETQQTAKKIGREEFMDYMTALQPTERKLGTALDVAAARPEDKAMAAMLPQNIDMGQVAQSIGAPTAGIAPQGTGPAFQAPQFAVGGAPMTPGQRRAKLLEGLGSDNPMIQSVAQAEFAKPPVTGKIGDVQPDKFTPASLAQYQATGNAAVLVPVEKESKAPTAVQEYEYARGQGYKGSFRDFQNERARAGASSTVVSYGAPVAGVDDKGNPVFFQPEKGGGKPAIIPGVRPKPEAMGQAESTAALFADRMSQSAPVLDALPPPSIGAAARAGLPGVGNILTSDQNRQFLQAERNFITAVLRRESGAAISESEFKEARKLYIPQAGDDPQTLQMKKQAREAAINGIARGAGPTYKPPSIPGAPAAGGWGKAEAVR